MSASTPSAETGRAPASQYFAMRGWTPAAAAHCSAVLRGQMPRAALACTVHSIALANMAVPRFSIVPGMELDTDSFVNTNAPKDYAGTEQLKL